MFREPRVNVIESDEGFAVEVLGRTGLRYSEGSRSVKVDSEVVMGPAGLALYKSSIRAWADGGDIDEPERARIVENIRRAFAFKGYDITVI
jgi:hypothetical protein